MFHALQVLEVKGIEQTVKTLFCPAFDDLYWEKSS
jgi:hypothetical protein